jgi:outer membrane protein, heavy metal efflux system
MIAMARHLWLAVALLALAGCNMPVREEIDSLVCKSAQHTIDRQPNTAADTGLLTLPPEEPTKQGKTMTDRLEVPKAITFDTKPLEMPSPKQTPKDEYQSKLQKAADKYFPVLPETGADPMVSPGPNGHPMTLADLQRLAAANSPELREAAANVKIAEGVMEQQGLYFNPTLGIDGQTIGKSGGPLWGPTLAQTISTMGKLKLAQAAAQMDLENSQLAYRRAETDLAAAVRGLYFQVLIADENIRQVHALVDLTDEVYKVMRQKFILGGDVAAYEPMQVGVFAAQARSGLIQARNSFSTAWKQLAAKMGIPGMPPTQLAGRIRDLPVPQFRYDTVLAHVLADHTDVKTAEYGILKARYNLRLQEVTAIPDVSVQVGLTQDLTPPGPERLYANFGVNFQLPVFNYNQGNIRSARAGLVFAMEEPHRVRESLTFGVADAFNRYDTGMKQLELNIKSILPNQVQAFRATVLRHDQAELGAVAYNDLVSAEQNLVSVIQTYFTVLSGAWQAVVDLASFAQTDDIFQLAEGRQFADLPNLSAVLPLDCCHPCSPVQGAVLKGADLHWPSAGMGPAPKGKLLPPQFPEVPMAAPAEHNPFTLGPPPTAPRVSATQPDGLDMVSDAPHLGARGPNQ